MSLDKSEPTAHQGDEEATEALEQYASLGQQAMPGVPASAPGEGVVVLPSGVELSDIRVAGRDLVVTLPDGSEMVIDDGAVFVPTFVIEGVEIPPLNLVALLIGQEPQPAAGGAPQSSGGNFAGPVGDIGDPVDLGDLLPPTALQFDRPDDIELAQAVAPDEEDDAPPDVVVVTPENPVGVASATDTVFEAGLPARDGESPGSASETDGETTSGAIVISAGDTAVDTVTINGTEITAVGQTITTPFGVLTITAISDTEIDYSYTLTDNTSGNNTSDDFAITVTEVDGDAANATLSIRIVDDTPTARDDTAGLVEGGATSVTVDVDTNDTPGADSTQSREFTTLTGTYGSLTLNADGTQTYTLSAAGIAAADALAPGETLTDIFDYTLTDGDNDSDPATLTVTITGTDDGVEISNLTPAAEGGDVTVDEDDLPAGSSPDASALTQAGTFTISAPDGVDTLTVGGVTVIADGVFTAVSFATAFGNTLSITGYDEATGTISYSYTLNGAQTHPDGDGENNLFEDFTVVLTDTDGDDDTDTLSVNLVDDVPAADDDADSVTEDGPTTADGNVLTGSGGSDANATDGAADIQGADGAEVTGVVFGVAASATGDVGAPVDGDYGSITIDANGDYVYALDNDNTIVQGLSAGETLTETFTYTMTDEDGDPSTTTVTITIHGANDGVVIDGLAVEGGEASVDEDDLPDGSDTTKESLTDSGEFSFEAPDGVETVTIGGQQIDLDGGFPQTITSGSYGTLVITGFTKVLAADGTIIGGTFTYEYTLDDNTLDHPAAGQDSIFESYAVVVVDEDGSDDTASLDIEVVDDVPDALDDPSRSVAEDGAQIGGNLLANDVEGADGATLTSVTIGGQTTQVAASGTTMVSTANGAYTFMADGTWTFDPSTGLDQSSGPVDAGFSYTITDDDGDTDTAEQPIEVTDGEGPPQQEGINLTVDDENLPDGSDPSAPVTDSDDIVFVPGSDPFDSIVFSTDLSGLGGGLTWTRIDDTTIVGSDGGTPIVTLTLNVSGNTATVTMTLDNNFDDHPTIDVDDLADLGSVAVVATDIDGSAATGSVALSVSDDLPLAVNDTATQTTENQPFTIDAFLNDTFGADGVDIDNNPDVKVTFTQPSQGTVTYDPNTGLFTYTPDPGAGANSTSDSFTYTIEDGDGDTSTATVNVTLQSDSTPTVTVTDTTVDEKGLPAGTGELADGMAGNNSDTSETNGGSFTITTGGDTLKTLEIQDKDGNFIDVTNGGVVQGDNGVLTVTETNGSYTYSYTLTTALSHPDNNPNDGDGISGADDAIQGEAFTVRVTDSDDSTDTDTLDVTVRDDAPLIDLAVNDTNDSVMLVTQDAETEGAASDTATTTSANFGGAFSIASSLYGADGAGSTTVTYKLLLDVAEGTDSTLDSNGADIFLYINNAGEVIGSTAALEANVNAGNTIFKIATTANGTVTLTQFAEIDHDLPGDSSNYDSQTEALPTGFVSLEGTATITDSDGDVATDVETLDLGNNIKFADDGPDVTVSGAVTGLAVDETDLATDDTESQSGVFTVDYGADGAGSTSYTLGIKSSGADSGLVDTATGESVFLFLEGGEVVGRHGTDATDAQNNGAIVFKVSVSGSNVTLDQQRAVVHDINPDPNDTETLVADDLITLTATATDGDGDTDSATVNIGQDLTFFDDGPSATTPGSATVTNASGNMGTGSLDTVDGDVDNNYGADGPGAMIFTAATITSLLGQDLQSGSQSLSYEISNGGTTLTAFVEDGTNGGFQDAEDTKVFTIDLQPTGFADQYKITMFDKLDATSDVTFADNPNYDFVGGNNAWAGFQTAADDDSQDLLLTPILNGADGSTINSTDFSGGVGPGASIGPDEGFRVDYVVDLSNSPPNSGDYATAGNRNHQFEEHYTTNGASAEFFATSGSTIKIAAFDDNDLDIDVGDGTPDAITEIVVSYNGGEHVFTGTDTQTIGGRQFIVTFLNDGTVTVEGVEGGGGSQAEGTNIAVFTSDGYTSLEFSHVAGDDFKIGNFGAVIETDDPVDFTVPVSIVDGDGDALASGELDITADPAVVAPITANSFMIVEEDSGETPGLLQAEQPQATSLQKMTAQQFSSEALNTTLIAATAVGAAGIAAQAGAETGNDAMIVDDASHSAEFVLGTASTATVAPAEAEGSGESVVNSGDASGEADTATFVSAPDHSPDDDSGSLDSAGAAGENDGEPADLLPDTQMTEPASTEVSEIVEMSAMPAVPQSADAGDEQSLEGEPEGGSQPDVAEIVADALEQAPTDDGDIPALLDALTPAGAPAGDAGVLAAATQSAMIVDYVALPDALNLSLPDAAVADLAGGLANG